MIFDAHTHPPRLSEPAVDSDGRDYAPMLARMDACGIDRALLLGAVGISQTPTAEQIRLVNDHTLAGLRAWPDRFSGLCYLNPALDRAFVHEEMDRCIGSGRMVGVKLWVAVNARDPRHDVILRRCAELDCMLLYHAWHKTVQRTPHESDPTDIAVLARRHPDVRMVMAHMMGGGVRGVSDVAACPNVWIDISGSAPTAGVLEYALATIGAQRIVYGSDWPVRDFATQLGKLDGAGIHGPDRDAITWGNLRTLMGSRRPC